MSMGIDRDGSIETDPGTVLATDTNVDADIDIDIDIDTDIDIDIDIDIKKDVDTLMTSPI